MRNIIYFTFLTFSCQFCEIVLSTSQNVLPLGHPCEILRLFHSNGSMFNLPLSIDVGSCREGVNCVFYGTSKYRQIDGRCNNLNIGKSLWGSKHSEFKRLVKRVKLIRENYPPSFSFKKKNRPLPNARDISSQVHIGNDSTYKDITVMVMQIGQFLDHDLTLTEETNMCQIDKCPASTRIDCCDFVDFKTLMPNNAPFGCMPILVSENDEFYSKLTPKIRCLDFKISKKAPACSGTSKKNSEEATNSLTSFLDASQIYGSDEKQALKLRDAADGLMKIENQNNLPMETNGCPQNAPSQFIAGDSRVNQIPGLTALHTLWIKEHNRIAKELKTFHSDWNSEKLYQESRRWVIAQWQHIVYDEFLRILLGDDFLHHSNELNVHKDSHYNPNESPDILQSFSTAAFRFGHSLISNNVDLYSNGSLLRHLDLRTQFFNITELRNGQFESILEGMWSQPSEYVNSKISSFVRNFLFRRRGTNFGSDLAARNIQRGRDHALPPYETFREICGLTPLPTSFSSPHPPEFTTDSWFKLSRVYAEPEDIELFPGGMSEIPRGSALVGPTFFCIIFEQFRRTRIGDRYFYTHVNLPKSIGFCENEKKEIRSRRLSDIICDNSNISIVPINMFKHYIGNKKNLLDCKKSRKLNVGVNCPSYYNYNATISTHGMAVLLVGGFDKNEILDSVELYSPEGTCQCRLPSFPLKIYNIHLQYIKDDIILACGGKTTEEYSQKQCYRLDNSTMNWSYFPNLNLSFSRHLSASTIFKNDWILCGGLESSNTMERLSTSHSFSEWKWKIEERIPSLALQKHCLITIENELYLFGGKNNETQIQKYNLLDHSWTSLNQSLLIPNYNLHCVLLPTQNIFIMSNEQGFVYNPYTFKLTLTPKALYPREIGAVIRLGDHIFLLGDESVIVEEYDYKKNQFNVVPFSIDRKRSHFGITGVPSRIFNKYCEECK